MTTQSDPGMPPVTDDDLVENTLIRSTGEQCPETGYWKVKGLDGKDHFVKGEKFPQYQGRNVQWQGAYKS